jgi:hypothetical protein
VSHFGGIVAHAARQREMTIADFGLSGIARPLAGLDGLILCVVLSMYLRVGARGEILSGQDKLLSAIGHFAMGIEIQ